MVTVDDVRMRELVLDAWRMVLPKRLAEAFREAESGNTRGPRRIATGDG